jgi:hypothetical protein
VRRWDGLEGTKIMQWIQRIGISAAALVLSSAAAGAAPALTLGDLSMRAGSGTDSLIVITVPSGGTVDVLGCDANGWCSVRFGRFADPMNQAYLSGTQSFFGRFPSNARGARFLDLPQCAA